MEELDIKELEAVAERLEDKLNEDKFITVLSLLEKLHEDFPKDAFYAGLAILLTRKYEELNLKCPITSDLVKQLAEYCKHQSKYF